MKFLLGFFLLLEVFLPLTVALIWLFNPPGHWGNLWAGLIRMGAICGGLPIYGIYAFILAKAHAPERLRDWLLVFSPLLWGFISALYFSSAIELWDILQWEGLSLYLGSNLTLCIGLWSLLYLKEDARWEPGAWITLILISGLVFGPALVAGWMGWQASGTWINELGGSPGTAFVVYGDYILGIGWTAFGLWPVLKSSYEEGLL